MRSGRSAILVTRTDPGAFREHRHPGQGATGVLRVASGTVGRCSYCITRLARGRHATRRPGSPDAVGVFSPQEHTNQVTAHLPLGLDRGESFPTSCAGYRASWDDCHPGGDDAPRLGHRYPGRSGRGVPQRGLPVSPPPRSVRFGRSERTAWLHLADVIGSWMRSGRSSGYDDPDLNLFGLNGRVPGDTAPPPV